MPRRRPVVLLHGLAAPTGWWDSTVAALDGRYDVRVATVSGFRYREAATWLADWLDDEGLAGATVVGHSMGGLAAVLAAAEAPERIGRLALVAPAGIFAVRSRRSYVIPVVRSVATTRRFVQSARDAVRVGPIRLWRVASDLLSADVAPVLRSVRVPTLVVWGADDRLLPATLGSVFCSEIPDCRLVVLERCGHVPMLEAPEALNEALLEFIEKGEHDAR